MPWIASIRPLPRLDVDWNARAEAIKHRLTLAKLFHVVFLRILSNISRVRKSVNQQQDIVSRIVEKLKTDGAVRLREEGRGDKGW